MAKANKKVSNIQAIESYFTTDSEHHNKYTFNLYNEARENELFTDLETPLWLFDNATNEFYKNKKKPLQTLNNLKETFKERKLTKKQQVFILKHLIEYFENTVYLDESGKNEISLEQVAALLTKEYEAIKPKNEYEYTPPKSSYNFDEVKKHLETLPTVSEKIKYLINKKTDYQQNKQGFEWNTGTPFDKQLELEIERQKEIVQLEINTSKIQNSTAKKESIKWLKNSVLLAYLINELKTYGYIDETNIWKICEQIFTDKKGNSIKSETFTSMVNNYENNKTPNGTKGKPAKDADITTLIENLKKISKELNT